MKRLRLYMIVFCVLVSLPLTFVAWRTYATLNREAQAQVRFFSERLLDEIETELSELVQREEGRVVDEYRHTLVQDGGTLPSPLAETPVEPFIIGYFQNNPDGSFQTPLVSNSGAKTAHLENRVRQLQSINMIFNQRKFVRQQPEELPVKRQKQKVVAKKEQSSFSDRFLRTTEPKKSKSVLGQEQARVEEITAGQAMNLAQKEPERYASLMERDVAAEISADAQPSSAYGQAASLAPTPASAREQRQSETGAAGKPDGGRFRVEVAPLQAVAIDDDRVFIFRRIGINGQIYRQGFVLQLTPFLDHLLAAHYDAQPIARYTRLTLNAASRMTVRDQSNGATGITSGSQVAERTFPAPFGFINAQMYAVSLPPSPARQTLTLALVVLGVVLVAGMVTIYHSASTVLDLSERRSQFVSSVTHELKTPLTNIRMYIEMLDQGIAATPEREQEYFGILSSESARLSGLINNVLELSRLEKQTRRFDLKEGDLSDVLDDVQSIMAESLAREGFNLVIEADQRPVFAYDREVLVQVLINLMENSIKFGRHLPEKLITIAARADGEWVMLTVSDCGPGIPKPALKHVFDDFYRADNDLTRTTGGTGIGLALVKKFILAMGGRVRVDNHDGPGCTISISLPKIPEIA